MFFLTNRKEFTFKPFHEIIIQKLQDIADCKNTKKNLCLNLPVGCVSGDTRIRINRRGGISREINIKTAYENFKHLGSKRYWWKNDKPFYTRSAKDNVLCLQEVDDITYSGVKNVYLLELEDGKSLKATSNHRILTQSGYKELGKLTKEDLVAVDKGQIDYSRVKSITYVGKEDTYDLTIKPNGQEPNFTANNIIIHNSGKSLIIEFFITWTFARNPSVKHLYVSHSETLITKLSRETLEIIESDFWQDLYGRRLDQKSSTQYNFIDAGTRSGMTAAPIGSAITGIDAGNPSIEGFNGSLCLDGNTKVWTNKGFIKIKDIVDKRLDVQVYSFNKKTKKIELKPIIGYHDNGIKEVININGVLATPNHKFLTKDFQWLEAIKCSNNIVTAPNPFNLAKIKPSLFAKFFSFKLSISYKVKSFLRKFFSNKFSINSFAFNMFKGFTLFDLDNSGRISIKRFSNFSDASYILFNRQNICNSQISMAHRQRTASNRILHIIRFSSVSKIFQSIIRWIIIKMSGFNSFFLFANKRTKNKLVNANRRSNTIFRVFIKCYIIITLIIDWSKNMTSKFHIPFAPYNGSIKTSNSTKIRHLIKTLKIWDISPQFHNKAPYKSNVYCLSVKDNHNFIIANNHWLNQLLVAHNCIDDPIDVSNSDSDVMLNDCIRLYTDKLKTRLRTPTTPIILVMQRLSTNDLTQYLMDAESDDWDFVEVKAYNEETGESFWEEKYPPKMLMNIKIRTPELYYSQYQQDPRAKGSGLYTEDMFLTEPLPDFFDFVAIVADTAYKEGQRNDWTVFMAVGKANNRMYIIDVLRRKVNSDKVKDLFLPFIEKYAVYDGFIGCYIEPKGHGIYLNQLLPEIGVPMPSEIQIKQFYKDRRRDKYIRANVVLPYIATNKITFSDSIDKFLVQDIISECLEFPNGKHDDAEDCICDAAKLIYKWEPSILDVI